MSRLSEGEIITGIARLAPWFHCLELAPGIYSKTRSEGYEPTDHPRSTWDVVRRCLPADLTGHSLLDVGCNAGFYAVEARRLGASPVLGIDSQRLHVRQARFVRDALGLDLQVRRMSVYELSSQRVGRFDICLALGLVYHLKHIVLALERLFEVTRKLLVLESAVAPPGQLPEPFQYHRVGLDRALYPLAWVDNSADLKEAIYNWFLPTPESLMAMARSVGFAEVELFEHFGNRVVVKCRKPSVFPDSSAIGCLGSRLELELGPVRARPGEELCFRLRAENVGQASWLGVGSAGSRRAAVHLGAHLLDAAEEELIWHYLDVALIDEVEPGESAVIEARVRAPERPGRYIIEFDLLAEGITWFEDLGLDTWKHPLTVE